MDIETGKYLNVPMSTYKQWDAFSSHGVMPMLRSGRHYWVMAVNSRTPTESMVLGQLVDAMLLENSRMEEFFITPETYTSVDKKGKEEIKSWSLRSFTCKAIYQQAIDEGKTPVDFNQITTAKIMVEEVNKSRAARELLDGAETQVCYVWDQQLPSGKKCRCKARLDARKEGSVTDLKTTWNASPSAFSREIHKYNYHIQAAVYSEAESIFSGGVVPIYSLIAVENELPHCVAVYDLGADSIATGKAMWVEAMEKYVIEKESGWKGYSEYNEPIDIPVYAIKQGLDEGVYNV